MKWRERQEDSLNQLLPAADEDLDPGADLPSQRFRRDHNIQRGAFSRSREGGVADSEHGSVGPTAPKAVQSPPVTHVSPTRRLSRVGIHGARPLPGPGRRASKSRPRLSGVSAA